jgi:hypothetical protein
MTEKPITARVALVEDDVTLVINRGAQAGITTGMVLAVYSETGQMITDPESGAELGRLPREALRVRVFEVHPRFARAHTYADVTDVYGLLQYPFEDPPTDTVVTVNVGDPVAVVDASRRSASTSPTRRLGDAAGL